MNNFITQVLLHIWQRAKKSQLVQRWPLLETHFKKNYVSPNGTHKQAKVSEKWRHPFLPPTSVHRVHSHFKIHFVDIKGWRKHYENEWAWLGLTPMINYFSLDIGGAIHNRICNVKKCLIRERFIWTMYNFDKIEKIQI